MAFDLAVPAAFGGIAGEGLLDFASANITANGRGNVRTINAAVSDAPGRLTFYLERATNLDGTTSVRPRTVEASFEADTAPLPTLLTEEELTAARLIKIDVEGGEAAAVRGLTPVLNGLRDDVELVVEVTPRTLAKQGRSVDDVLGPLLDHGFHAYRLANDYAAASYPAALRRPAPPVRWRGAARGLESIGRRGAVEVRKQEVEKSGGGRRK
ncbi:FkbM family methyltransferase, partial [Streptomyces mirabilis]